jgi:hypothetical protein
MFGLTVGVGLAVDVGVAVGVALGVVVGVAVAVGVGGGLNCAQYLPPVLNNIKGLSAYPPQTIISVPVHTAV